MKIRHYLFFMCGQLGVMLLARFFFQWILHFANQPNPTDPTDMLFAPAAVGGVLLLFRIFDAVSDPLAGMLSDRWVRRGKERRVLLLFWFLVPGLGLVLCFLPDFTAVATVRWTLLLSGMLIFFLGYTFFAIPYWSLVDDYAMGDDGRRGRLSNLLGAGLMLATALGFIATPLAVNSLGYTAAVCVVAALGSGLMVLPYFASPRDYMPQTVHVQDSVTLSFDDLLGALRHRHFLALCLLYVGSQMSLTIMTSAAPFVAVQLLDRTEAAVALLMGPLLGLAIVSFLFVPKLSRRYGWERTSVGASLLLALVYGAGLWIGSPIVGSAFTTAVLVFALAGPLIAVLLGVEAEGISDCARHAGEGKVSCYFGVFNLIVKAGNGMAIFIAGILVQLSTTALGSTAIKLMLAAAALSLLVGVACYFLLIQSTEKSTRLT